MGFAAVAGEARERDVRRGAEPDDDAAAAAAPGGAAAGRVEHRGAAARPADDARQPGASQSVHTHTHHTT